MQVLLLRLTLRLAGRDRLKRTICGALLIWTSLSCAFSYGAVRFRATRGANEAYARGADPSWLAPFGVACAVIGGVIVLSALVWPIRSLEDHSPATDGRPWAVLVVLLLPFDGIAIATSVTAPDGPNTWAPILLAGICSAVLIFSRSLWKPTRRNPNNRKQEAGL